MLNVDIKTKKNNINADLSNNIRQLQSNIRQNGGSAKELFIITLDEGTADKSPEEIYQAAQEGKYPVIIGFVDDEYGIIPIHTASEERATGSILFDTTELAIVINSDKTVTGYYKTLAEEDDIPDTSDFITNTVNDLLNYYLKSETYNKQEVNNLISSITTVSFEVAQEKPINPQTNVIYLIPKNPTQQDNIYDEWIYVNNNWELIGTTEIDLSNYYTKSEVYNKTEIDAKTLYDASYLFEETPITNTHYNELVNAITSKARIHFSIETGNFDAIGRAYDEETGNIAIMLTVGDVERFNGTDYAVDEAAVFEIDGTTKEVSLKAGNNNGAEIAQKLDILNTKINNKPDINTDQLENYYTKQETDTLIQNALYVDTEDEVV